MQGLIQSVVCVNVPSGSASGTIILDIALSLAQKFLMSDPFKEAVTHSQSEECSWCSFEPVGWTD